MTKKLILSLAAICMTLSLASADPAQKPNIIFIFADDWGWGDLSCHDHPYVKTPNIDRLATEGTDFHNFTVASGVCSPSRAAIFTGHFPARYGIDGHFAWVPDNARRNMPDWLPTDAPSLPRILQKAGYRTAHYGKWHLSNNMIPDSPAPSEYGYDDYGAFNCSGEQMPYDDDCDRTIAFIKESQKKKAPFFVNLWIHEPHTPFHVLPKYRQQFPELEEADNIYAATLAYADERIGKVLDALDALELTDETLVIFSSDNGPARASKPKKPELTYDSASGAGYGIGAAKGITAGRKGHKASLFQGGINVPFIARWPKHIAANATNTTNLLSAVDLLPTFASLAKAPLPDGYQPDGLDQTATLLGQNDSEKTRSKALFWKSVAKWPAHEDQPHHWVAYAMIDGAYKLVTSTEQEHVELYNLEADPLEKNNLANSEKETTATLLKKLKQWQSTLPTAPPANTFSKLRNTPEE